MSEQKSSNRKSKRVAGVAKIIGANTEGTIYNLSHDGVGFTVEKNIERFIVGKAQTLFLKFDESELFPTGVALNLHGVVRFKIEDFAGENTKVGVEFDSVADSDQQILDRLIELWDETNHFYGI